jgi:hypothetical protein
VFHLVTEREAHRLIKVERGVHPLTKVEREVYRLIKVEKDATDHQVLVILEGFFFLLKIDSR